VPCVPSGTLDGRKYMPGWRPTGSGSRRAPIRRPVPRSRLIDPALNDPLEDLLNDRPADKAPIAKPRPTSAVPVSPSDARSLEIQAQLEAESRRIAWQKTYGNTRSESYSSAPDIPTDRLPSAGTGQTAPVSSPSVIPKLPPERPKAVPTEPPARWRNFTPIGFNSLEAIQGVYAIVQITTGRLYVGSSNHVVRRFNDHLAALRAQRHHAAKLQEAWRAAGGEGFRFLLVERVVGSIEALRDREQYWIAELRAFPQGFNSKSTADGPEPSLHTQIDAAIKERLAGIYTSLVPGKANYQPNDADRSSYRGEMKAAWRKKLKHTAIAFLLAVVASDPYSGLRILWVGVLGCALFILFDWPDSPQKRADPRAEADYREAEAEARHKADSLLIGQLAAELGLQEEKIRAAYDDAPRIVQRRNELREKYRRRNAWLKYRG
jgi:group I intron endonuclease